MSLLKRIEQGQGRTPDQQKPNSPSSSGGEKDGGLSALHARRVSAPSTT
jgi:hypothetical protein